MLVLEALRAKHGDALLLHSGTAAKPQLVVIDGGPPGVYADSVKPRLLELRDERGLGAKESLEIALMMVSHIDADHIAGILELANKLRAVQVAKQPRPWKIKRFWHNSFDDILDNSDAALAATGSSFGAADLGGFLPHDGSALLASVTEGRALRDLVRAMKLDRNPPFGGLVMAPAKAVKIGDLEMTVVAPGKANLLALQKKWDKEIKPKVKKAKSGDAAKIADFVDKSVHNLSSIVVLVESQGKRLLLTGDGRGDHTLAGLKAAKLFDAQGRIELDVLKMPHHGSVHNVNLEYFQKIRADHYVISADGRDDNPDVATLELLTTARQDDDFTIHLTYPTNAFNVPEIGKRVAAFFTKQRKAGRKYDVVLRDKDALSVRLELA
jgi:hypothetical protein